MKRTLRSGRWRRASSASFLPLISCVTTSVNSSLFQACWREAQFPRGAVAVDARVARPPGWLRMPHPPGPAAAWRASGGPEPNRGFVVSPGRIGMSFYLAGGGPSGPQLIPSLAKRRRWAGSLPMGRMVFREHGVNVALSEPRTIPHPEPRCANDLDVAEGRMPGVGRDG